MKKILFEERQSFNQSWLQIPLLLIGAGNIILFIWGFITQIIHGIPWGSKPMPDGALIAATIVVILIWTTIYLLFRFAILTTVVSMEGLEIKFPPFIQNPKVIRKDMIKHWEFRKYNPMLEYGGWGVRYGRKGKAYNVKGRIGLQLEFINGKKLLIGTQKKDQFQWAIEKFLDTKNT